MKAKYVRTRKLWYYEIGLIGGGIACLWFTWSMDRDDLVRKYEREFKELDKQSDIACAASNIMLLTGAYRVRVHKGGVGFEVEEEEVLV